VLCVVLAINAAMFLVELVAGIIAQSTALLADSADMLGDAIVYGFSVYVIARGPVWHARAALLKGGIMAAFGAGVLVEVGTKLARGVTSADLMSGPVCSLWWPTPRFWPFSGGTGPMVSTCGRSGSAPGMTSRQCRSAPGALGSLTGSAWPTSPLVSDRQPVLDVGCQRDARRPPRRAELPPR
jgi:hypothetical protein